MSVRFKFRSSVGFDTADLGGRPSIPVRDLRVKILEQKNLLICRDFDLVISDADTGEAYEDEDFPIREGSSVIIKRVPTASRFNEAIGNPVTKPTGFLDALVPSPSPLENVKIDDFDDFGNDFYPALGVSSLDSDIDVVNTNNCERRKNGDVLSSETSILKCQNLERSNLSEDMPKGNTREYGGINCAVKEDTKRTMLKDKMKQNKYFEGDADVASPALLSVDLPTELRCSLCYTIFKDAVMIPCCQHSFCDKCIRSALVERESCPKCSSKKCTIEDLLPNLSLRQAIEHFLDAQKPLSVSDKVLPNYVPDGESGIQAKEVSFAMSIGQKEQLLPDSPSATCKGSNQVMAEFACESLMRNRVQNAGTASHIIRLDSKKVSKTAASLDRTVLRKDDINTAQENLKHVADLQGGGGSLKLPQNPLQEEASLAAKKKKGLWGTTADGNAPNKHKKGDRNCYMCGSPDHLVRDCPEASAPYQMLQTGDGGFHGGMPVYGPPYWQGTSFPHPRPYANLYGLPFDPTMVPVTPYEISPYMPSFYAGLPLPCGIMRMGGVAQTMVPGADRPLSRAEFMEFQDSDRRRKLFNEHLEREQTYYGDDLVDEDHYNDPRGSYDRKPLLKKDIDRSYSGDDVPRLHKKHPRDKHSYSQSHQRPDFTSEEEEESRPVDWKNEKRSHLSVSSRVQRSCYSEKSNSKIQDLSDGSIQHNRERTKHRQRISSKRHSERRGQCGSDGSRRSHHRSRNETSTDKETVKTHRKHGRKHHNYSESALEPDSSNDRRQHLKEKDSSHTSRHSRHKGKSSDDQLENGRWEMVDCMDEDYSNEYHGHKRKRTHYT